MTHEKHLTGYFMTSAAVLHIQPPPPSPPTSRSFYSSGPAGTRIIAEKMLHTWVVRKASEPVLLGLG